MRGIIDRFEGDYAVIELENYKIMSLHINKLPKGAKEGDIIIIKENSILVDKEETFKRKEKINNIINNIFDRKQRK